MTAIVFFSPGVEYFFVWNNSYYIHAESFRILGHRTAPHNETFSYAAD